MFNIIIPVYNSLNTLPKTLDSLVAQTRTDNFIVTIVQDGDNVIYDDLITNYQARGLHISLTKLETNEGPGLAREAGIYRGPQFCDYIMFLDSDDVLLPYAAAVMYREARSSGADIIMCDYYREDGPGIVKHIKVKQASITWLSGSKMFKRQFLRDNYIEFHSDIRLNEDSYFSLVTHHLASNIKLIEQPMVIMRENKNSLTRKDSTLTFMKNSYEDYIKSQVYGLEKIQYHNKKLDTINLAALIVNVYKMFELAESQRWKLYKSRELLKQLKGILKIENENQFWEYVHARAPQSEYFKDEGYIQFPRTFQSWFNKYLK